MDNQLYPAYLWVGSYSEINLYLNKFLKNILCLVNSDGCNACINCRNIEKKQHYLVCWLEPEKQQYSINQLDIIFKTIAFSLDKNQHFFFVINKAELLNNTCANSLLKSLEEPPPGYHFILIASKKEGLLSTIISRCIIQEFYSSDLQKDKLLEYFTSNINLDSQILKQIETLKISEQESIILIDQIYNYWSNILKSTDNRNNQEKLYKAYKIIKILDNSRAYLPMPGSSKIFFKNLFLQILAAFYNC